MSVEITPKRLLICASDAAAADNLGPVALEAAADRRFEPIVVAGDPAAGILSKQGVSIEARYTVRTDRPFGPEAETLLAHARALLDRFEPDAVLVGLSGPDAGLDEALLVAATAYPSFALQDYWGDVNPVFPEGPDVFLVADAAARRLTEERTGVPSAVVGLPKYDGYSDLDVGHMRREARKHLGLDPGTALIGLFGQPLWQAPGYESVVSDMLKAVSRVDRPAVLAVRPHPRDSGPERTKLFDAARAAGSTLVDTRFLDTNQVLAGCDLVVSACSMAALDLAHLNLGSPEPLAVPVFALTDPGFRKFYTDYTGLPSIPLADLGIALESHSDRVLEDDMRRALMPKTRSAVRERTREALAGPSNATAKVLGTILDHCGRSTK